MKKWLVDKNDPSLPACYSIYMELAECLVVSDCMKNGRSIKQCLADADATPSCQIIRESFRLCKRSKVFYPWIVSCYKFRWIIGKE